jgi:hypothetical protein
VAETSNAAVSGAPVRRFLLDGVVKGVVDLVVRLEVTELAGQHVDVHVWHRLPCGRAVLQRSTGGTQKDTSSSRASQKGSFQEYRVNKNGASSTCTVRVNASAWW